ncbi:MAG: hybrid sensor histidine kinase/response regulator [Elusimicrobia bacterium]|nr:hybrid sensor histidine kinase/response regulator [Elusimicrobiota bacterium]
MPGVTRAIKVLLVEDNPHDAKVVENLLNSAVPPQFELSEAGSLEQACARDEAERADVILLDLNLPDSFGAKTLISAREMFQGRPIIVMTGRYEKMLGVQLVKKGAQDYIVKGALTAPSLSYSIRFAIERARNEARITQVETSLRALLEKLPDGIIVVRGGGVVAFANLSAQRLTGRELDNILSSPYALPPATDGPVELDLLRQDGRKVPLQIREAEIDWAGERSRLVILHDLTARRELEYNRGEFISRVSHELRSPLTIVRESMDLIYDGSTGPVSQQQKELLRMGLDNVTRLNGLIDSLLDITKMEAGVMPMDVAETDLRALLASTAEDYVRLAAERSVKLDRLLPAGPMTAYCDANKLRQVLDNLVSNAIKFTPEAGKITLSLSPMEGQALFCVENTGPGIQPEDLPKLFGKFTQLNNTGAAGIKGTGLGLAISRGIMEMHGGSIWAESEPGGWCKFFALLPLRSFSDSARLLVRRELAAASPKKRFCALALALPENVRISAESSHEKSGGVCASIKNSLRSSHARVTGGEWDLLVFLPDCGTKESAKAMAFVQGALEKAGGISPQEASSRIITLLYPDDFTDEDGFIAALRAARERIYA